MIEQITNALKQSGIPEELIVFIISLMPILEIRGGLIAAALLDVRLLVAFPICIIGNILPIPFILLFIKKILRLFKKSKLLSPIAVKIEEKAEKQSKKVKRGKEIGLLLFVGVPLPGTGGWTGALVADFLGLRVKHSFIIISLGVVLAGIIMAVLTYFIPGLFGFSLNI
ncbi:MAG: small multi-drug export protein [Oscillospiraceae bacterium]|nr:small multi-drug export protein [Candidatus Equicaccousia limihippi]